MRTVLIVEDSPTQAEHLASHLRDAGFDVDVANDAEQALARCAERKFDVILSDIIMPGKSGYDLCRELKERADAYDVPVILLTTLSDPMAIIDALACGAENFITKPYDPAYLVSRVGDVIANRERRSGRRLTTETEIAFLGKRFVINSDKEQILNLLVSTFEDVVRTNRGLEESHAALRDADRQLKIHSAQLARSNKELEAFVYTVSHDLKEPLRGIEAFSRIVADDYCERLDDEGRRYLRLVYDSAVRMRQLIDDLLAFARVGHPQSRPTSVGLGSVVQDAVAGLQFSIEDVHASVQVPPDLPTIVGHGVLLRELFLNLIGNAIKYRRRDVVPTIAIGWRSLAGDTIEVTVADNGIGVPAEHRQRVFGLFQRLHGREDYPGTGVGLALCKRIVEEHCGGIALEDTPGGGCTVRLTLSHPEAASTPERAPDARLTSNEPAVTDPSVAR